MSVEFEKPVSLGLSLRKAAIGIGLMAALGTFATYRFMRAGTWVPTVPERIGALEAIDTPVSASILAMLGNPKAVGREYRSPFGDLVTFSAVSAGPFENYHDPTICVGGGAFELTARREVPLDGAGSPAARAMIFRHRQNKQIRLVMYYWQQSRDGATANEPRMGNYKDMMARLETGFGAVVLGQQNVILRIYAMYLDTDDPEGKHAQYLVHDVSRATYRHLLKVGKEG
jgi:hypothetical protein